MNLTKVAAWSEIVSSVAILATLVYLGVQMQQNTAAMQAQSRQAMFEADREAITVWRNDPGLVLDFLAEEELSSERKIRLHSHLLAPMRNSEYQWFQYRNGVLDETAWRSYQNIVSLILGTKRTRKWWKQVGHMGFDREFVQIVDGLVEGQPYTDYYDKILALE